MLNSLLRIAIELRDKTLALKNAPRNTYDARSESEIDTNMRNIQRNSGKIGIVF